MSAQENVSAQEPEGRTSGAFGQAAVPETPPSLRARIVEALLAIVRDPNPILLKELRATLRTPLFVRFLYLATGLVAMVVLMGSATVSETDSSPAEVGRAIFHIFFCTIAVVLVFAAPSQAASAMTLEKETKTWESLLLSGMSPTRIVLGKFFAVYASILLVIIAVAPVIGVGFLFGGVSPLAVLVAFGWLLGALAVAVSFGIAVSVRMESTRSAVSATTVIFIPLTMLWSSFVVMLGEPARSEWGTPFDGPIWFGPAFAERYESLDAWLLLIALPVYFFTMVTWLNLAGAVAGVNAPGVDRSTGLKLWAIYAAAGTALTVVGTVFMANDASDAGEMAVAFSAFALALVFPVIALVFANEPPLPPRVGAPKGILRRLLWDMIGPGAGPTLRFTLATLAFGIGGMVLGTVAARYYAWPSATMNRMGDAGALLLGCAGISVLSALAATAAWLRSLLRNGAAARMLAIVIFVGLTFGSMVAGSLVDPRAIDHLDTAVNPLIGLSPLGPLIIAIRFIDGRSPDEAELGTAALACLVYALMAFALWILVEVRARQVGVLVEEHRRKLIEKLGPVGASVLRPAEPEVFSVASPVAVHAESSTVAAPASEASSAASAEDEAGGPPSEPER